VVEGLGDHVPRLHDAAIDGDQELVLGELRGRDVDRTMGTVVLP